MKGDRVEAVVDTGQGTRTFEITASRAGRRLEVTSARGIVEVTEVTRHGTPVRTGRFMAARLIALVEHPALESDGAGVDVSTRRRLGATAGALRTAPVRPERDTGGRRPAAGRSGRGGTASSERAALPDDAAVEAAEPDPTDEVTAVDG